MRTKNVTICVKDDFTDTPGPSKAEYGEYSGEEFLNKYLKPHFGEGQDYKVILNLDGVCGYPGAWVEEVFKGLIEYDTSLEAYERLHIVCRDDPDVKIWALGWMVDVLEAKKAV